MNELFLIDILIRQIIFEFLLYVMHRHAEVLSISSLSLDTLMNE